MKVMSEKQKKCIKWICDMLDIKYEGSESSYDAWRFIKENKKAADEVALGEKEADEFILGLMAQVRYPKYHVSYDNGKKEFYDEFDGINLDKDTIDEICPNGIHCADDIKEFNWMFAIHNNRCM